MRSLQAKRRATPTLVGHQVQGFDGIPSESLSPDTRRPKELDEVNAYDIAHILASKGAYKLKVGYRDTRSTSASLPNPMIRIDLG